MVERLRPKRRIMRTFKLSEISAVDNPAQVHARAVIMKRDDGPDRVEKKYKSTSELPPAVKDNLPASAQRQFLAVVNSAMGGGASDSSAFQQAWGALRNAGWKKDAKGKWMKKAEGAVEKDYYDGAAYPTELAENIQAVDFDTVLAEQEAREAAHEVGEDLREKWCALQRSFNTIAADESVTAADKVTRMQASLQQYIDSLAEQSAEIAETMTKHLSADSAFAKLLEKSEEGDDEMNAAVKKQLDELQETMKEIAEQVGKTDAPDDLTKQMASVQSRIDEIVAKAAEGDAERAELVAKAGMSDDEKAYMDKMSDGDKKAFMMMSPEDRKKKMSKAADADPVVYKSEATGEEFRKSDDPRLVKLAKQADEDRRETQEMRKRAEDAEFAKRADDELKHFSEDVAKREDKIDVLRAISKMEDGPRAALTKMLEVGGKAVAAAFDTIGHKGGDIAKSAEAFEKRVNEIATRDSCTRTQALEKAAREYPEEAAAYRDAN